MRQKSPPKKEKPRRLGVKDLQEKKQRKKRGEAQRLPKKVDRGGKGREAEKGSGERSEEGTKSPLLAREGVRGRHVRGRPPEPRDPTRHSRERYHWQRTGAERRVTSL